LNCLQISKIHPTVMLIKFFFFTFYCPSLRKIFPSVTVKKFGHAIHDVCVWCNIDIFFSCQMLTFSFSPVRPFLYKSYIWFLVNNLKISVMCSPVAYLSTVMCILCRQSPDSDYWVWTSSNRLIIGLSG
jgi:hypothetical protein